MKAGKAILRSPILWGVIALSLVVFCLARRHAASNGLQPLAVFSGSTMGTEYTVKVVRPPGSVDLETLEEGIRRKLARVDDLMSTYKSDSEISRLNRWDRVEWFEVSPETAAVIEEALRVGHVTHGAFDVTVGPLVNLWTFGPEPDSRGDVPSPERIEAARKRVGLQYLEVRRRPPAVRKTRTDLCVDLSGIAKGFAADQVAEHLERCGVRDYLVEVGGELRVKGHNRRQEPWQVAIESPLVGVRGIQRIVPLTDGGMATSGDYRNYFEKDGVRYSHIIDPRTAAPVSHRLASVTVLAPSCARADAWATALMVLGPEAGYQLALAEGMPAFFVVRGGAGFVERATPNFPEVLPR
jgi:thiamine biosynthesis lipoprotein